MKPLRNSSKISRTDACVAATIASVVGGVVLAIGTLLPWPALGARTRNGYELASTLGALGTQLDLTSARVVAATWFVVPATIGVRLVGAAVGRRWSEIVVCVWSVGALVISVVAISASQRVGLSDRSIGPWTCAAGAGLIAAGALVGAIRAPTRDARSTTRRATRRPDDD